jgi:hypothetical protein
MIDTLDSTPAQPQSPVLLHDLNTFLSGWDPSRPVSDLIAALRDRSNLAASAAVPRKRKRVKCMSRRRGQKVKIEPHGGWYTFRARVDVEGQIKRPFRRIPVSPIDPAATGWLNASECFRKAVKMMAALEGRNEEVVEGDEKGSKVLDNLIDVRQTGVVPTEAAGTNPSVPTFAEQAEVFMESAVQARSTKRMRWTYLNSWLLPALGNLPLDKITNKKVKELVAWMNKGGPIPGERE